ncbi:hypothetical protein SCH01S_53_00430 [Sphingomonas changbaiensis NBRC 104936]|uniref:Uncharacterized protein n=1 Tax=Sphingomonas changbaiensis NBRC 104936 TaxID=1219043 RepID=A0A0E9MU85_9SPHN|nr:hypothetical protein SCH01S_53_00430 [Sphingomonas changbaiensis NBRC 104936]
MLRVAGSLAGKDELVCEATEQLIKDSLAAEAEVGYRAVPRRGDVYVECIIGVSA